MEKILNFRKGEKHDKLANPKNRVYARKREWMFIRRNVYIQDKRNVANHTLLVARCIK